MKKNIPVGQSGGPTAVISASLHGVIAEGMARPEKVDHVYGVVNGIEGFLSSHVTNLSLLTHKDLSLLKQTPAAYLGSYRFKPPENLDAPVYSFLFEKFTAMDTGACLYIDGNDSMNTVDKLSRYARIRRETISFIGVPKTTDNDLPVTGRTPGYGGTAKYVVSTVREISLDASVYRQPAATVVELVGCHAGWVMAVGALAGGYSGDNPLLIYTPGVPFSMKQLSKDVEQVLSHQSNVVIYVSEGMCDEKGRFICEYTSGVQINIFGHRMFTGCAEILESYVRNRFRVKVRSVELSVNQRYSSLLASTADMEGTKCSDRRAAEKAPQGETGKMVTCFRLSGPGYELEYGPTEVSNVCDHEKSFPVEWTTARGSGIGLGFLNYALPLIQGQPDHIMGNGLPKYLYRK